MKTLKRFDPYSQKPESLGAVWRLTKTSRVAICTMATHPLGWELTVNLDGELVHSQVCKTESEVFRTLETWRSLWESKGWTGFA